MIITYCEYCGINGPATGPCITTVDGIHKFVHALTKGNDRAHLLKVYYIIFITYKYYIYI